MTPTEIAALSDHELKWEIALKLGWRNLQRVDLIPDGIDGIKGWAPGSHDFIDVPDWSRDPTASAELRRELFARIKLHSLVVDMEPDRAQVRIQTATDYFHPIWVTCRVVGADYILAECRAVAEAALAVLTEGLFCGPLIEGDEDHENLIRQ